MLEDDPAARLSRRNPAPGHIVEYADVVHDQAVRLLLAEGAVCPADGLQEVVVLHRLVEIHHLQDGRIEACEQLAGDDHELERISRVAKTVEQLLLGVFVADVLFPFGGIALGGGHDDGAGFGVDQLIHRLLVEHAALAVKDHHLGLESVGLHLLLEVSDDMLNHGPDALRVLDQHCHLGGALGQVVSVLLAQGCR